MERAKERKAGREMGKGKILGERRKKEKEKKGKNCGRKKQLEKNWRDNQRRVG